MKIKFLEKYLIYFNFYYIHFKLLYSIFKVPESYLIKKKIALKGRA